MKQVSKRPYQEDVRKISEIFYPLPPSPHLVMKYSTKSKQPPHYVCFWTSPSPSQCGHPLFMAPMYRAEKISSYVVERMLQAS